MVDPTAINYGDVTFTDTHPALTSAVARLRGLQTTPVDSARILELGCGTGFNLMAIAESLPDARCVGIDLSAAHIQRANEVAARTRATNVEFHCVSIDEFQPEPGSFDYIIVHGVYSWVPPAIRDAIFSLVRQALVPNGLAFVSYNTFPGWHTRSIVRDGLRFFAQSPNPRESLELLTHSLVRPKSIYAQALAGEWADASQQPDYYLYHEHLVTYCNPFYVTDFVRDAEKHQLQFVAEARFFTNSFAQPEELAAHLDQPGYDLIRREQHLDWLVGRYFRSTLLCHAQIPLHPEPDQETLLAHTVARTSESSGDDLCQQILDQLAPTVALPASEIDLPGPLLIPVLWAGWQQHLWQIRTDVPVLGSSATIAGPLARVQAAEGPTCTDRLHRVVTLTPEERQRILATDA